MSDNPLQNLEAKLDLLIQQSNRLADENRLLKQQQSTWLVERTRLTEKNDLARIRVEAMIGRLKSLESDA